MGCCGNDCCFLAYNSKKFGLEGVPKRNHSFDNLAYRHMYKVQEIIGLPKMVRM